MIELTPPRMAVMREMKAGECRLFHGGEKRRQWTGPKSAASIATNIGGKFTSAAVTVVDLSTGESVIATLVQCVEPSEPRKKHGRKSRTVEIKLVDRNENVAGVFYSGTQSFTQWADADANHFFSNGGTAELKYTDSEFQRVRVCASRVDVLNTLKDMMA